MLLGLACFFDLNKVYLPTYLGRNLELIQKTVTVSEDGEEGGGYPILKVHLEGPCRCFSFLGGVITICYIY